MVIREGLEMDLSTKIKNKMLIIILTCFVLLLTHCAHRDFDFNPWTTVGKKMLEYNETN
jgi:hypothetical protein